MSYNEQVSPNCCHKQLKLFLRYNEYEVLVGESEFKKGFNKWAEFRNPYMDQDK